MINIHDWTLIIKIPFLLKDLNDKTEFLILSICSGDISNFTNFDSNAAI